MAKGSGAKNDKAGMKQKGGKKAAGAAAPPPMMTPTVLPKGKKAAKAAGC